MGDEFHTVYLLPERPRPATMECRTPQRTRVAPKKTRKTHLECRNAEDRLADSNNKASATVLWELVRHDAHHNVQTASIHILAFLVVLHILKTYIVKRRVQRPTVEIIDHARSSINKCIKCCYLQLTDQMQATYVPNQILRNQQETLVTQTPTN